VSRTTWAPPRAAGPHGAVGGGAFDDRVPTQPLAVGRHRGGPVLDGRYPRVPPHAADRRASSGRRQPPARTAPGSARVVILVLVAVAIAGVIGALGYRTVVSSFPWAAPDGPARSAPTGGAASRDRQADDVPGRPPPPGSGGHGERRGALGEADGAVPDGLTVFDEDVPAVANLDPDLLEALRRAATDAADGGVEFTVNSGWRSGEYQEHLLDEAIAEYGSKEAAARWVATADTSPHVSGDAIDIGPTAAATWLSEHGAAYGLCQIYRNEPWHYELRPGAADRGCPRMYADPTHDPRMQK
jgi:D-alanyl-D-alanine carboxypeptidase